MYQVHTEDKAGHHSQIKSQSPCEIEYKDNCLNSECYFIVDENIVGCNFS